MIIPDLVSPPMHLTSHDKNCFAVSQSFSIHYENLTVRRALGRARLIINLICLSVSTSPVTLKARHTDGEGLLRVFMMTTKIRRKGGFSEVAFLNCGMMTHWCAVIKGKARQKQLVPYY